MRLINLILISAADATLFNYFSASKFICNFSRFINFNPFLTKMKIFQLMLLILYLFSITHIWLIHYMNDMQRQQQCQYSYWTTIPLPYLGNWLGGKFERYTSIWTGNINTRWGSKLKLRVLDSLITFKRN